jgi:hypothetical protein
LPVKPRPRRRRRASLSGASPTPGGGGPFTPQARLTHGRASSILPVIFLRPHRRAGDGIRTRDPQLGKLMLYQLSYSRIATASHGIYHRLTFAEPPVRIELTTARLRIECSTSELRWRVSPLCPASRMELRGLEPLTSAVRLQRSPRLSYSPDCPPPAPRYAAARPTTNDQRCDGGHYYLYGRDRTRTCDLYDVNVAL